MSEVKFFYISAATGKEKEGALSLQDYENASNTQMSLSAYLAKKYPDADPRYGDVFMQACKNLGIHIYPEPKKGIVASTVHDVMTGVARPSGLQLASGSTIVAPSTQGTTPATRLFFPETVMRLMNEALVEDYGPEAAIWSRMITETDVIGTEMFTQPLINVTAPRSERSQPIAQNTMPRQLVSITSSQYAKSIQTVSIGLQISEQAQRNVAMNLVGIVLLQQATGERFARLWEDINAVVAGNTDTSQAALTAVKAVDLDSGAGSGTMTQKAWLTALYDPTRKVSYDSMICDLNAFLAIQGRTNRPVIMDPRTNVANVGDLGNYGLNVEPNVLNWAVGVPNCMIVPTGTVAASHVLLFDSRSALRRVVNASAQYSAIQDLVLQRASAMRFDAGEMTYRLLDEAFKYLDFASAS